MIEKLKPILFLLTLTCFFTFFLFGFTIYHKQKFERAEHYLLGCGTINSDPYAIAPQKLSLRDSIQSAQLRGGETVFNRNCKACHRINQQLVGPALKGVFDRRDSVWIRTLITNIDILIKRKDKQVQQLRKEYNYAEHTRFESMPKDDLDNLLIYLKEAGNTVY